MVEELLSENFLQKMRERTMPRVMQESGEHRMLAVGGVYRAAAVAGSRIVHATGKVSYPKGVGEARVFGTVKHKVEHAVLLDAPETLKHLVVDDLSNQLMKPIALARECNIAVDGITEDVSSAERLRLGGHEGIIPALTLCG